MLRLARKLRALWQAFGVLALNLLPLLQHFGGSANVKRLNRWLASQIGESNIFEFQK